MDTDGNVKNSWEEMAALTMDFFTKVLGDAPDATAQGIDPILLEEVLVEQSNRVSDAEREKLNAPISLDELGDWCGNLRWGNALDLTETQLNFIKRIG